MEPGERGMELAFLKGRQTGLTTASMTLLFWHLDMRGGLTIHAVPTQANSEKVNSTIVIPALQGTEFRHLRRGELWNKTIKSFVGEHSATYVLGHTLGGNQTADGDNFRSLTAEIVIFDERGTMPEKACAVIESTTDTCDAPVFWNVGTAGYRGDALDKLFRKGTQAEWAIPCPSCAKHTVLMPYGSGPEEIEGCLAFVNGDWAYVCEHCAGVIDPGAGEWVHGVAGYRSYHIASMASHFFPAYKLHRKLENPNTTEESLMREVAGLPFGGEGVTIEPSDIKTMPLPKLSELPECVMSADWGTRSSWLVLRGNSERVYVSRIGQVDGKHDEHVGKLQAVALAEMPSRIICDFGYQGGRNEKLNDLNGATWTIHTGRTPTPGNVYEQVRLERKTRTYHVVKAWVWERLVEDIRSTRVVLGPGLELLHEDILSVAPAKAGRGSGEFITYDTTDQHYASCLLMAYAIWLRELVRPRRNRVGTGNAVTGAGVARERPQGETAYVTPTGA
jgi:hypothetical protein